MQLSIASSIKLLSSHFMHLVHLADVSIENCNIDDEDEEEEVK